MSRGIAPGMSPQNTKKYTAFIIKTHIKNIKLKTKRLKIASRTINLDSHTQAHLNSYPNKTKLKFKMELKPLTFDPRRVEYN